MLASDLRQLLDDFADDGGAPAAVVVLHPDDWDDLCGFYGWGTAFMPTNRSGLQVGGVQVRRSRDVERGRPEVY